MNEQKKTRGRPRNIEVALLPPPNALRKIKQMSRETKIPIDQVYEDALENGLVTLPEMYSSLIKFRKEREKLYESQFNDGMVEESDPGESEGIHTGEEDKSLDPEFCDAPGAEDPDEEGSRSDAGESAGYDGENAELSAYAI